ncbi:MAG TPA: IS1182 family transposase [Planctomycetota bacterium]|nr:IS1182 family transposase [Planctomycetota bacterium]
MGFIAANRSQMRLLGYSLDDFVPAEARCRFVVRIVQELDLSGLYADYSPQGGDAYDPATLLATWFFAYSEGISSTRRLEALCGRDMHYMYVSANLQPDHTTLSRFRQRHAGRLSEYFVQIIRLAAEREVSAFHHILIDGSKFQAASSSRQNRGVKDLQAELAKVKERIAEYLKRSELLDEEDAERGELGEVRRKIERLQALERTLNERQTQLDERKRALQTKDRSKHKINLVEPEARNMNRVNGHPAAPAYNAQLSVDAETQLIVAAQVSDAPNDRNEFSRQHTEVEENLGADPQRQYTTDAGYHSLEQLEYVDEENVNAVIADPRPGTRTASDAEQTQPGQTPEVFRRGDFRYDRDADEYDCPAGGRLKYWYTENKRGRRIRHYRTGDCAGCSQRKRCMAGSKPGTNRTVTRDEAEQLAEAMGRKAASPDGRRRLKERATTVEPVIGNLKANLGFRRFRLRGKAKAGAEFLLMCIGHNLGKLHGLMSSGFRRSAAAAGITLDRLLSLVNRWPGRFIEQLWRHQAPPFSHAA